MRGIKKKQKTELYRKMLLIRRVQLAIEAEYGKDEMKTPVHLYIGQEAIASGVCAALETIDVVFSNHRSHGHYLARDGNLDSFIAELYCKKTGCSGARGGSMHLTDLSKGLIGSSSIVAGNIPVAAGAALSFKARNIKGVSVVFFGDAATEEGVFYETLNFAALKKLPVVFICENNFYSVFSQIRARQSNPRITERVKGFLIPAFYIDGTDVLKVYEKAAEAVRYARSGKGPVFLECAAYRFRGHAGPGDEHKDKYRNLTEWKKWIKKDPVKAFEKKLERENILKPGMKEKIAEELDRKITKAFSLAQKAPLPGKEELYDGLYAPSERQ